MSTQTVLPTQRASLELLELLELQDPRSGPCTLYSVAVTLVMYAVIGIPTRPCRRDLVPPQPPNPVYLDRGISTRTRNNVKRFLDDGWHLTAIAARERCSLHAVTNVCENLDKFVNVRVLCSANLGNLRVSLMKMDKRCLMSSFSLAGLSRYLKKRDWGQRKLRPFSVNRNEDLRQGYRVRMAQYVQEDLCFIDEAIFNEKSGWRHKAYAPVADCRYSQDIRCGDTWAIPPAYTAQHGYLPCTGIKEGY
ncbi:hypothetical protein PMIN01_13497 [Paraphaeosphaeria minitans]|uniref:Uncharacterized protein n=1 Tax=Paraphaeosphaeria minitans TaxID=565426 RepID=A0A9P6G4A4_9PLEO|nr:hypothetical protein PMIN01_13497 [Paraphaeosphaeria minitans]